MPNLITEQDAENFLVSILKGIGLVFYCLFLGFMELTKKITLIVFAIAVGIFVSMSLGYLVFDIVEKRYALYSFALPVLVVLVLGAMRKQKQSYYEKRFLDAGFKGKDGRTPIYIDSVKSGHKTKIYFKSNISLSAWKKNKEAIQTTLDIKIFSIKQGKSKKIACMEYVAPDYDLPTMLPWKPEYLSKISSEIVLGESDHSQIIIDFNDIAHWIVAGSPGTGKSGLIRLIAYQCFLKGFKVYIMDFKRGMEFGKIYDSFCEVVMDKKRAAEILQEITKECVRNCDIIRDTEFKNIDEYNKAHVDDPMQRNVIIIDELAVALMSGKNKEDKEFTDIMTSCLEQDAIIGRAPGFNLVFGIQRPDAQTVTGQIKTNVAGRISGFFTDVAPSQIVLNNSRATELPPPSEVKGRYMISYGLESIEFQGYYLDDFKAMRKLLEARENQHPEQLNKKTKKKTPPPARAASAGTTPAKTIENIDELFIYEDEGEPCNDDNDSKIGKKRKGGEKAKSKASQSKTRKAS